MTTSQSQDLYKGAIITIAATFSVCLMDVIAKYLVEIYSPFQISFLRALVGFALICGYIVIGRKAHLLRTKRPKLHLLRAVLITLMYMIFFYALAHIPLVVIEAIAHSAPFYVALLSPWLLQEKVSMHGWFAIVIGFIGIALILRPDTGVFHIAYPLMLLAACFYAVMIITARVMRDSESLLAMNFYMYPLPVLVLGSVAVNQWQDPSSLHWLGFILVGILGTIGMLLFIYAIRFIEATTAATLDYFTLVWASLFGFVFWREVPGPVTIAGILLVVASGIYIVRHSTRRTDETIMETTDH